MNTLTLYEQMENKCRSKYERRCIDGKITGCGNCVGYCQYSEHPGFLTAKQRDKHDCINKQCFYYIAKERTARKRNISFSIDSGLIAFAEKYTKELEGMKILRAENKNGRCWSLKYITITDDYPVKEIEIELSNETGYDIKLEKLNYSFDVCAKLLFS